MMSLTNLKMKSFIALIMMSAIFSTSAAPNRQRRRLVLDFQNQIFRQHSQIKLKQEIKRQYPNFNFQKFDLVRAVLVAKSKRGYGQAYLKVGPFESRTETIDGNRYDFHSNNNYQRTIFTAPRPNDRGVWQIHMQGKIKVKRIVIVAKKKFQQRRQRYVTRQCQFMLQTRRGRNIRMFSAQAQGPAHTGVQAQACHKARRKCVSFKREFPFAQCSRL